MKVMDLAERRACARIGVDQLQNERMGNVAPTRKRNPSYLKSGTRFVSASLRHTGQTFRTKELQPILDSLHIPPGFGDTKSVGIGEQTSGVSYI